MGQLGNGGNDVPRPAPPSAVNPERISNDPGFSTLKASGSGTCAITTSGADLYCWGGNRNGQLGLPDSDSPTAPSRVEIGIGMDVIAVDLGIRGHGCAAEQRDAGGLVCWGSNSNQQLGHQAGGDWQEPTAVEGISGTLQIGTGERHSCVLQADHRVRCFGVNDRGQLGIGGVGADFGANRDAVVGIGGP
jgi:alpha-tubulin suppressor-like RCC1 family protein